MITANLRATATIALAMQLLLAICKPQDLSADHDFDRVSNLIAASNR